MKVKKGAMHKGSMKVDKGPSECRHSMYEKNSKMHSPKPGITDGKSKNGGMSY